MKENYKDEIILKIVDLVNLLNKNNIRINIPYDFDIERLSINDLLKMLSYYS